MRREKQEQKGGPHERSPASALEDPGARGEQSRAVGRRRRAERAARADLRGALVRERLAAQPPRVPRAFGARARVQRLDRAARDRALERGLHGGLLSKATPKRKGPRERAFPVAQAPRSHAAARARSTAGTRPGTSGARG